MKYQDWEQRKNKGEQSPRPRHKWGGGTKIYQFVYSTHRLTVRRVVLHFNGVTGSWNCNVNHIKGTVIVYTTLLKRPSEVKRRTTAYSRRCSRTEKSNKIIHVPILNRLHVWIPDRKSNLEKVTLEDIHAYIHTYIYTVAHIYSNTHASIQYIIPAIHIRWQCYKGHCIMQSVNPSIHTCT